MSLLLAALLLSGLASAGAGITSAVLSKNAQDEANRTNIELQKMANDAQIQQVRETNEFNAAEAQKQRDFEAEMSNTSIQRQMADMSAAGVNPLMAVGGSGAAVPSGASAQGTVANIGAAKVAPSSLDLTSISSAVQSMTNFLLTAKLLDTKGSFADSYAKQVSSRNALNTSKAILNNEMTKSIANRNAYSKFGSTWNRYR